MFKPKVDFNDLKGPFLVYSFRENKIVYVSYEMLELLELDSIRNFELKTDNKLESVIRKEDYNDLLSRYQNGEVYFGIDVTLYAYGKNKYAKGVVNIKKGKNDYAYLFFVDITKDVIESNNKKIRNDEIINNRGLLISSFLEIFDLVCWIRLDTFKACQISEDSGIFVKRELSVEWDEYYKFIMQLIDSKDYDRLKDAASKTGLLKILNSEVGHRIYYFSSTFDFSTGLLKEDLKSSRYSLNIAIRHYNNIPYAYIMIKKEDEIDSISYKNDKSVFHQFVYHSTVYFDYETLKLVKYETKLNSDDANFTLNSVGNYDELRIVYENKYVLQTERENFLNKTDIDKVKEEIEKKGVYFFYFTTSSNEEKLSMLSFKKEGKLLVVQNRDEINDYNLTTKDSLTNLLNLDGFLECLNREIKSNNKGYVVRLDIDHFSYYNSIFGHLAGDEVLKKLASILREYAKTYNSFSCRLSADIFYLYLPVNLEELDKIIKELDIKIKDIDDVFDFAITYGVASVDGNSAQQIIENSVTASDFIKNKTNKNYCVFDKNLLKQIEDRKNNLLNVVNLIKDNKLKVGFRKIYNSNGKIIGFDSGVYNNKDLFLNQQENIFMFLEHNKMALKLNKRVAPYVFDVLSNVWTKSKDYCFIAYVSNRYILNDNYREQLITFVKSSDIPSDRFILALQADSYDEELGSNINAFNEFKKLGVSLIIDYSNSQKFDFTLSKILNITNFKLDLRNFMNLNNVVDYNLLEDIVKNNKKVHNNVLISHADEKTIEILKNFDNAYYTKNEDLLSSDDILKM